MFGHDQSVKMSNRSGLPIKNIITAVFIVLSLYMLYLYNGVQNRLHDAELTGARYRRETEEKANEIQGMIAAKDESLERSESEKRELSNRLKSINQKHSMLQSQNTEIEADFMKLKQDMENLRAEHMQTENQHAQEYQTLKQNKEKEISDLTDQMTSVKSQNEELQNTITVLRAQVQSYDAELGKTLDMIQTLQTDKKNLVEQNAQLQLLQYQQAKQQELQKQNEVNAKQAEALQEQHKQLNVVPEGEHQANAEPPADGAPVVMSQGNQGNQEMLQNLGNAPAAGSNLGQDVKSDKKDDASKIDELNSLNQAKPPNMNPIEAGKEAVEEPKAGSEQRPEVNPNDLQKGQILEPLKQDGGEADREGNMDLNAVEERREKEELDNLAADHKDPLDLGQMQQPLSLDGNGQLGDNALDKQEQQQPPVVEMKNDENGLDMDQRQYYQNREEEEDEPMDEGDEEEGKGKDDDFEQEENLDNKIDDPMNALQHFDMPLAAKSQMALEEEEEDFEAEEEEDDKYDDNHVENNKEENDEYNSNRHPAVGV